MRLSSYIRAPIKYEDNDTRSFLTFWIYSVKPNRNANPIANNQTSSEHWGRNNTWLWWAKAKSYLNRVKNTLDQKSRMHPLCGALSVPYMLVRVTRGALIAHRYTYAPPRCRTSQYRRTFIPLSVPLWNDLVDPVFDGVRSVGFKSRSNAFLLA